MLLDCVHRNVCKFTEDRPCVEIHCVDFLQEAEKTASPNTTKAEIKPKWCGYNDVGCLHVTKMCDKNNSGGCTFHRPV